MNRTLLALVIAEAIVIALLAYLWLAGPEAARHSDRRSGVEQQPESRAAAKKSEASAAEPTSPEIEAEGARETSERAAAAAGYAVVHGRVTSSDGGTLKPPIWLGITKPGGEQAYAQVSPDGYYAAAGLSPGRHTIRASGQAYGDAEVTLDLPAGSTRQDFELAAAMAIRITVVTPEGKPLPPVAGIITGVIGVATKAPIARLPLTELRAHTRFGLGEYQEGWASRGPKMPEGVVGVLMVKAAPPFHVSAVFSHLVLASREVTERVEEITFVLKPEDLEAQLATVKVRVVDAESGEPVQGRVSITDRQSGAAGAMADENGLAVNQRVPPGLKDFQLWAQGYEMVQHYLRLPEPGEYDLGTMRLHKAVTIEGEVLGSDGKPLAANLTVRNLDRMTFPQPLSTSMRYRSDTAGKFKVPGAGRGRYVVVASVKDHALAATIVDTSGGAVDNVRMRVGKGTPVVLEPQDAASRHFLVTIRRDGVPYYTRMARGKWPLKCVLEPGDYEIEVAVDGVAVRTDTLGVGSEPVTRAIAR